MTLLEVFREVHEPKDRVALIQPLDCAYPALGVDIPCFGPDDQAAGRVPSSLDMLLCLEVLPRLGAHEVSAWTAGLAQMVRPGGMLFLTAWTTDHSLWQQPGASWSKSGSRQLTHSETREHRFFLHDDEIVTLFAAWNILHHTEDPEGLVEVALLKPEGRTVDVSTALFEG